MALRESMGSGAMCDRGARHSPDNEPSYTGLCSTCQCSSGGATTTYQGHPQVQKH
jgi:hypothetical protein